MVSNENEDKNNINSSPLVVPSAKRTADKTRVKADTECNY